MNVLAASTSTIYGDTYLNYIKPEILSLFKHCKNIVFIPFARPGGVTWDEYTAFAGKFFKTLELPFKGIHSGDMMENIEKADGFFTGGGNSFVLLKTLQENKLLPLLRERILLGVPYLGTSAGSNILGESIRTTNDMPVVELGSLEALKIFPFNINPHYPEKTGDTKHMGESRETRLREYVIFNETPVLGLREGSYLQAGKMEIFLRGNLKTQLFTKGGEKDIEPGEDIRGVIG